MARMLRWTALTLFVGLWMDGCLDSANSERSARRFEPLLLGKWCLPAVAGRCRSHEEYRADGILQACFFVPEDKQVRLARVKARYSFEMQNSCITVIESDTKAFTIGQTSCWEILSIDSKSFTYEIAETGVTDSMTRLPATAPECPPLQ